jgi:uncharacterized membrane protein YidH (DUF202 family)
VQTSILAIAATLTILIFAVDEEDYYGEYEKLYPIQNYFVTGTFGVFLIVYSIVLHLLTRRLKRFYPKFYQKERKKLITVNSLIILSISVRVVISVVNGTEAFNKFISDSFNKNTIGYPLMQFSIVFFTSLMPISTIIYSLMHAFNQKKKMIER